MLTSTSEQIKRLEDKITALEDELRIKDRALEAQKKLMADKDLKLRKLKAECGILKRAFLILTEEEVDG